MRDNQQRRRPVEDAAQALAQRLRIKGRKTFAYWRGLRRTQWLGRAELEQLQLDALRRLIIHASTRCAYYEQNWETLGLDVRRLQNVARDKSK